MLLTRTKAFVTAMATASLTFTGGCTDATEKMATACEKMHSELQTVNAQTKKQGNNLTAVADVYTNAATKIRRHGAQAGGEVQASAENTATAFEQTAAALRTASSSAQKFPDMTTAMQAAAELEDACS